MNILILRHSALQQEINDKNSKPDAVTANNLEHTAGYALNKKQLESIKIGNPIYIIDRNNRLAFKGTIAGQSLCYVNFRKRKEKRQVFVSKDVKEHEFMDIPYAKGWETHRRVKVMPQSDFLNLFGK